MTLVRPIRRKKKGTLEFVLRCVHEAKKKTLWQSLSRKRREENNKKEKTEHRGDDRQAPPLSSFLRGVKGGEAGHFQAVLAALKSFPHQSSSASSSSAWTHGADGTAAAARVRCVPAELSDRHPAAVHLAGGREPHPGRGGGAARAAHRPLRRPWRGGPAGGRGLRAARLLPGGEPRHRPGAAGRGPPVHGHLLHAAPPGEAPRAAAAGRELRLRQQLHGALRQQAAVEGDALLPLLLHLPGRRLCRRLLCRKARRGTPPPRGCFRSLLLGDEPSFAADDGGSGREPWRWSAPLPALLRAQRLHHAAQLLPAVPASPGDAGHRPPLRPHLPHHPPPGPRRRPPGLLRRPLALHPPARRRLRRQHRRHLHGALQRPLPELPAPRRGQQPRAAQVARLLPLPGDGQGGVPAGGAARRRQAQGVPGLHVADTAGLHAEALQGGHEDAPGLLQLDPPWQGQGGTPDALISYIRALPCSYVLASYCN